MPIKVHLPDGRVVNFPDWMSQEQIQAEVAKFAQPSPEAPRQGPQVPQERTWTDTAVDALPTVGGAVGGILGGVKGPIAMGGAALGGGFGEALRQTANRFRGQPAPGTMTEAASQIGQAGMTQAAAEGGGRLISGALRMAAAPIYNLGLSASKALRTQYPNLARTGIDEGIAVSGRGTDKARMLRGQSARQADIAITKAEQAGAAPISTNEVVRGGDFRGVAGEAQKRAQLGMVDDTADVAARARSLHLKNKAGVPLTEAQALKRTAQSSADQAFRTQQRGGTIRTVDQQLDKATATGLKKAIETRVPAVGAINQRTQALGGLTKGLEDAEKRNHILSQLLLPTLAAAGTGFVSGDPKAGVGAGLLMAGARSPGTLSRAAISMDRAGKWKIPEQMIRAAILANLESQQ